MLKNNKKIFTCFFSICIAALISGCARDKNPTNPLDPYEHFNRRTFAFNEQIDKIIYKPVAKVYDTVFPWPVKKGVSNFFNNLGEITNFANDLLQLDGRESAVDFSRFAINTTIGIGGLFDVAVKMGLERNYEDLGLTFAKWGAKKSPYFVIPFLGPSTIRDAIAFPINYFCLTPWEYIQPPELSWGLQGLKLVDMRAKLLPGDKVIKESFDPYVFVRDAYLQRRDTLMDENNSNATGEDTFVGGSENTVANTSATTTHRRKHVVGESTIVNN